MRKLALVLAVALASGRASALGMGEIELRSALNEPFNAEIRLLSAQPAELEGAVVRLAPQESFQQAGIERPAALSDLIFNVVRRDDGTAVIQVTSSQPVREPYLDFIVQLRWPTGRLLREYTVLLDPPLFSGDKLAPVSAPVAAAPTPAPAPAPKPPAAPSEQTAAKPTVSAPPATPRPPRNAPAGKAAAVPGARSYGPTQRSDTAWAIAEKVRPDNGVSVFQSMLALLAANPDAFYNGNVNNLLAGYVLRVPERELMTSLPAQQAEREVARQYDLWRQAKRGGVPMASAAQPTAETAKPASGQAPAAKPAGEETPRLKLVAPGQTAASVPGNGAKQGMDQVRNDLALALESADAARRENQELRSRLSALEGQLGSMQRLLTLKDDTLGNLQQGEETTPSAVTPGTETPAVENPLSATPPETPPPAPAPVAAPAQPEPSPVLEIFNNPVIVAALGGAVILLLAVAWLVARRRRGGGDNGDSDALLESVAAKTAPVLAPAEQVVTPNSLEAVTDAEEPFNARMSGVAEDVAKGAAKDMDETAGRLDVMHTAEGDIDPMVEADVYLAYRRYQQAEALIQSALAKQPHRHELKGKLLEIYYASRNVEAFQPLAEALYDDLGRNADQALWQRIVPMGSELLPNHPLFNPAIATSKNSQTAVGTSSALFAGDMAAARAGFGQDGSESGAYKDDGLFGDAAPVYEREQEVANLDLDLNAAAISGAAAEDKLDFDLNLGDEARSATFVDGQAEDMGSSLAAAPAQPQPESATVEDDLLSDITAGGKDRPWESEPALSDFGNMDFNLDDTDFLAGTDVVGTKLDLARAYIDMGDQESAREILNEVLAEGNDLQKQEARGLSEQLT